jgi:single-stranded DNA-specific DHH superfamily exonuclease
MGGLRPSDFGGRKVDFYTQFERLGKSNLLEVPEFKLPTFSTEGTVLDVLYDIIKNNSRVLFYGDYDPDGATSREILRETFNYCGHQNYDVFRYGNRTHKVDVAAVMRAIKEGFDYIIICDAGSSEPQLMRRLNSMGVKVILLDHHSSVYGYEDFPGTAMINTSFENRKLDEDILLSAGALTYIVCYKLIEKLGLPENKGLACLALVSLYADVIDMTNDLNRAIYYKAMSVNRTAMPKLIQRFLNQYSFFTRRFIQNQITPKLNSLFRSERFDVLNKLLDWRPETGITMQSIMETVNDLHNYYRHEVLKASDLIDVEVLNNFVIGNLSSVVGDVRLPADKLHSYTGVVASKLSEKHKKTAIVYADSGTDIKGSLRDKFSRNYLELFRQFSNANGHNAAFAINIPYIDYQHFMDYLRLVDKQFSIKSVMNLPILVEHNEETPDVALVRDMAMYNEFSGNLIPEAFITKIMKMKAPPKGEAFYHKYPWGKLKIKSEHPVRIFSETLLRPFRSWEGKEGWVPELIVEDILR